MEHTVWGSTSKIQNNAFTKCWMQLLHLNYGQFVQTHIALTRLGQRAHERAAASEHFAQIKCNDKCTSSNWKGIFIINYSEAVAHAQDTGHQAPGHSKVTAVTSDQPAHCHHHHYSYQLGRSTKARLPRCPCKRVELHQHNASSRRYCQSDCLSTHYLFMLIYICTYYCVLCNTHLNIWHKRHLCRFSGTTSCRCHKWTQPAYTCICICIHTYIYIYGIYQPFAPPPLEALHIHTINIACKLSCTRLVSQP